MIKLVWTTAQTEPAKKVHVYGRAAAAREELFKTIINRPGVATLPQVREYKEY